MFLGLRLREKASQKQRAECEGCSLSTLAGSQLDATVVGLYRNGNLPVNRFVSRT